MSVVKSASSMVFVHNKKSYNVPNIITNNKNNLTILNEIFKTYTYYEFIKNFDNIYNNSTEYNQRVCYWIYVICNEYKKRKTPSNTLNGIISELIKECSKTYRLNDKKFNLHLIGFILRWRYYKINFNNINTVEQFNKILGDLKLTNLTKDFPELITIFDRHFESVITQVNNAHKVYYESKKQQELIEIENNFRDSFKENFNKYKVAYEKLFKCNTLGYSVHNIIFALYDFNHCVAANIIDDMFKYGNYSEISRKYSGMSVDDYSIRITKILMKYLYEINCGCDIDEIGKELKNRFKVKEPSLLSFYQTHVYYFDDNNIKVIRELIYNK